MLYCVVIIQSRPSFCHYLSSLYPLLTVPTPFSCGNHHTVVCLWFFFVLGGFFLLNPFTFFIQALKPPPPDSCQSVSCIYESVSILFVYFVHQIPHIREIIWYLSFSDWLVSLSIILSRSIHVVTKSMISSFLWPSNTPLCKYTTTFLSTHLLMGIWALAKSGLL